MASFEAKFGWKRPRKRENTNIVSFRSYSMCNRNFQTNSQKIQKIRKIPFQLHLKKKQVENCLEREKIKIIVPFRSYTTRKKKNSKKKKKNSENLKIPFWLYFKP